MAVSQSCEQNYSPTDRYFMVIFWNAPGSTKIPFHFGQLCLQPLGAYRSTIPLTKEDVHSFFMSYISMICSKRLQSSEVPNCLSACPLVLTFTFMGSCVTKLTSWRLSLPKWEIASKCALMEELLHLQLWRKEHNSQPLYAQWCMIGQDWVINASALLFPVT